MVVCIPQRGGVPLRAWTATFRWRLGPARRWRYVKRGYWTAMVTVFDVTPLTVNTRGTLSLGDIPAGTITFT